MKYTFAALAVLVSLSLDAQISCIPLKPNAIQRIQNDINYLASDELEGRKPGTNGAAMAVKYIERVFKSNGLAPLPPLNTYTQNFSVPEDVEVTQNTFLLVDERAQKYKFDYFSTRYSSNKEASGTTVYVQFGIVAPELKRNDYKRKKIKKHPIVVMDIGSPDGVHPHSEYLKYHDLGERIALAKSKGAKAVLLVNVEGQASDLSPNYKQLRSSEIPVLFIQNTALAKRLIAGAKVELQVEQKENTIQAQNVIGFLNNHAAHTIIIGAHYDHLGYGGPNSLYAQKEEPTIHNGADDNASGTAGLLELVRNITSNSSKYPNHNFIFMAFSAEEEGLLGSAYFAKSGLLNLDSVSFMLNMDMIGRMEDSVLAVNGVGTSPFWAPTINDACGIKVKTTQSGVGPSDHTSFYNQNIPVLHFFTGTHSDYHKPSDDSEKINAEGIHMVLSYMLGVIERAKEQKDLTFTKTKAEQSDAPSFSVTLGVMPDYLYEGVGMKIDGVTEGKPAFNAGLQAGDVVLQLGDVKVVDMMSYMKGLGQFKKGDKTELTYSRKGVSKKVQIQF